jgi:hypothetical protein
MAKLTHLFLFGTLALSGCKKAPTEEPLSNFVSPKVGEWIYPLCKKENDGKRYLIRGYLRPGDTVSIEDGKLSMNLYGSAEGSGPSVGIELVEDKHVKFETGDMKNKWKAGGMQKEGKILGVTILTNKGNASLDEKVGVVVEQKVLTKFQSDEISACQLFVDEITK